MARLLTPPSDVQLPHDAEGFIRRCCPKCTRHFKLHTSSEEDALVQNVFHHFLSHANPDELPEVRERFCPYCGHSGDGAEFLIASHRSWIESCADALAGEVRYEVLHQVERRLGDNPFVTFVVLPPGPHRSNPGVEPNDLRREPMLCCRQEIKILPSWRSGLFCPHCGHRTRGDHEV